MKLRALIVVAVVAATVGSASIAEAKKIRSPVERRQHPGRGFWEDDDKSHKQTVRHHQPLFQHNWNPFWSTPKQVTPATKKSWGWQRSSRAEFHHPGPRRSR